MDNTSKDIEESTVRNQEFGVFGGKFLQKLNSFLVG